MLEPETLEEANALCPGEEVLYIAEHLSFEWKKAQKTFQSFAKKLNHSLPDESRLQGDAEIGQIKGGKGLYAFVPVVFNLADGQSISGVFHSPSNNRNKIMPDDEVISFVWKLNKKDITKFLRSPRGKQLTENQLAKQLAALAEKNSAKFQKQQADREARKNQLAMTQKDYNEVMAQVETIDADFKQIEETIAELTSMNEEKKQRIALLEAELKNLQELETEKAKQEQSEAQTENDNAPEEEPQPNQEPQLNQEPTPEDQTEEPKSTAEEETNPDVSSNAKVEEALVEINAIINGEYTDTTEIEAILDAVADTLEKEGVFDEHEPLLKQAAYVLSELMEKEFSKAA